MAEFVPGDSFGYDDSWLTDPYIDPSITDNGDGYTGAGDPNSQIVNASDPFSGYNLGGASGGGGLDLSSLAKLLGLTGKSGDLNSGGLLQLLSMLGGIGGAAMGYNATNKATGQMSGAVKDANAAITSILGGAQSAYAPYTQMGANAAAALPGAAYKPIAGNFRPLGSGQGINSGGMTLANLMRRK